MGFISDWVVSTTFGIIFHVSAFVKRWWKRMLLHAVGIFIGDKGKCFNYLQYWVENNGWDLPTSLHTIWPADLDFRAHPSAIMYIQSISQTPAPAQLYFSNTHIVDLWFTTTMIFTVSRREHIFRKPIT